MIEICEVGPRDGLQSEKKVLSVEQRVEMISRLAKTGVQKIECVSFVREDLIPQMAGAEQVMESLPEDLPAIRFAGLVLSAGGMQRALSLKRLTDIHVAVAASDAFNRKNVGRPTWDMVEKIATPIQEAIQAGKHVMATIATAFGCPYEGRISLDRVFKMTERFLELGDCTISLADTTGLATPQQVADVVGEFRREFPTTALSLHFHNTRGLGLANVWEGIKAGVTKFDSSIGGLGGCPYAPLAVGNVCSEDVVNMCEAMGMETGIDLDEYIEVAKWVETLVGRRMDGLVMKAGAIRL